MNWSYLMKDLGREFYTTPVMQLTSLLFIVIYFLTPRKSKSSTLLVTLAIASFTEDLIYEYQLLNINSLILYKHTIHNSISLYVAIEITCCLLYIRTYIMSVLAKKMIIIANILFIGYAIIYWIITPYNKHFHLHIEIIEGFVVILFCLYFFYEWLMEKKNRVLFIEPAFWAISGMLILFGTITPLFLMLDFIDTPLHRSLFAINNLAYGLLFATFIMTILHDKKHLKPI